MTPPIEAVTAFNRLNRGQRIELLKRLPKDLLPQPPEKAEKPAITILSDAHIDLIRQNLTPFTISLSRQYKEAYGQNRYIVVNDNLKNPEQRHKALRIRFFNDGKLEALMDLDIDLKKPRTRKELASLGLSRDPVTPREMLILTGKAMSDYSGIDALEAHFEIKRASESAKAVIEQFHNRGFFKKDEVIVEAPVQEQAAVSASDEDAFSISWEVPVAQENEHPSNDRSTSLGEIYRSLTGVYRQSTPKTQATKRESAKPVNLNIPAPVEHSKEALEHIENAVDRFAARIRRNTGHRNFLQSVETYLHDDHNQLTIRLRIREATNKPAHEKHPSPNAAFNSRLMVVRGYISHQGSAKHLGPVSLIEVTAQNQQRQTVKINDFDLRGISGFITALNEGGATTSQSLKKRNFHARGHESNDGPRKTYGRSDRYEARRKIRDDINELVISLALMDHETAKRDGKEFTI